MRSGRGGHRTWRRSSWRGWRATRRSRPTQDSRQRYEARSVRMWWTPDTGMLQLHGQLPDVMGATFEATIQQLTEQMKPAKGQRWDSFEHRAADALVYCVTSLRSRTKDRRWHRGRCCRSLCPVVMARRRSPGSRSPTPCWSNCAPTRPSSRCWSTTTASPIFIGKRTPAPPRRSCGRCCCATHCRSPTCDVTCGLQIHHLRPRSWGGTDDISEPDRHRHHLHPPSSPTGPRPWSATPTCPTDLRRSTSTTSAPNNANSSASHHHAPDRRPREEDDDVRCTSSRAPCALDARRRRRCRRARRRASG